LQKKVGSSPPNFDGVWRVAQFDPTQKRVEAAQNSFHVLGFFILMHVLAIQRNLQNV
jgi:hypothetical protein